MSPLASERQVLTFRTRAWLSFAPPTCRMTLGQSQDIPQADPGGRVTPRFCHRLISFRHFISGLLALASLNRAGRNHVPAFPQRSPPSLLTTAACGGLRSAPDCRTRRALLHLSYSCASPCGPAMLVTHGPTCDIDDPLGYVCRWGENGSGAVARVIDPFRKSSIRTDGKCRDAQCDRQATMR